MEIDPETLDAPSIYKLLTGIVVPRPIAWVTSVSSSGVVNAAPFSAFTWVSTEPAMLGFSCGLRAGTPKHTSRNIAAAGHYVVNIGNQSLVEKLHLSAMEYPEDVSEVAELGLATHPGVRVATPRIADVPVAMECVLDRILEFGQARAQFIIGRVVHIHIREGLCNNGKIDTVALEPIARLGGPNYGTLGEIITLSSFHIGPR